LINLLLSNYVFDIDNQMSDQDETLEFEVIECFTKCKIPDWAYQEVIKKQKVHSLNMIKCELPLWVLEEFWKNKINKDLEYNDRK
jgi:hypothetical protein